MKVFIVLVCCFFFLCVFDGPARQSMGEEMNNRHWELVRPYFSPDEKWGDASKIHYIHLLHLLIIRKTLEMNGHEWPMIIHCSFEKDGHEERSWHNRNDKSYATDFHFKTDGVPFKQQVIAIERALSDSHLQDFVGFGIYPDWRNKGFHIDSRGFSVRWGHIHGDYVYNMDVVKKYIENQGGVR